MEHQTVSPKCKKHVLENKLYQEFNGADKLLFSLKLRHEKSVTFRLCETGGHVEYDKWGRMTFELSSSGYWCMKFYDEPTNPHRVNVQPYQVMHKHWDKYNDLVGDSVGDVTTEFMGDEDEE